MYSESRGSRHTLFIRKVVAEDFKNYTCVADNGLGKNRQSLELSGEYLPTYFSTIPNIDIFSMCFIKMFLHLTV